MPFKKWLEMHHLDLIMPLFYETQTSQGYGFLEEVPTYYGKPDHFPLALLHISSQDAAPSCVHSAAQCEIQLATLRYSSAVMNGVVEAVDVHGASCPACMQAEVVCLYISSTKGQDFVSALRCLCLCLLLIHDHCLVRCCLTRLACVQR